MQASIVVSLINGLTKTFMQASKSTINSKLHQAQSIDSSSGGSSSSSGSSDTSSSDRW